MAYIKQYENMLRLAQQHQLFPANDGSFNLVAFHKEYRDALDWAVETYQPPQPFLSSGIWHDFIYWKAEQSVWKYCYGPRSPANLGPFPGIEPLDPRGQVPTAGMAASAQANAAAARPAPQRLPAAPEQQLTHRRVAANNQPAQTVPVGPQTIVAAKMELRKLNLVDNYNQVPRAPANSVTDPRYLALDLPFFQLRPDGRSPFSAVSYDPGAYPRFIGPSGRDIQAVERIFPKPIRIVCKKVPLDGTYFWAEVHKDEFRNKHYFLSLRVLETLKQAERFLLHYVAQQPLPTARNFAAAYTAGEYQPLEAPGHDGANPRPGRGGSRGGAARRGGRLPAINAAQQPPTTPQVVAQQQYNPTIGLQPPRAAFKVSEEPLTVTAEPTRGRYYISRRGELTTRREAKAKQRAKSRALKTRDPAVNAAHSLRIGTTQDTDRCRVLIEQARYDAKAANDPNFSKQRVERGTRTPKTEELLEMLALRNQLSMSSESLCNALEHCNPEHVKDNSNNSELKFLFWARQYLPPHRLISGRWRFARFSTHSLLRGVEHKPGKGPSTARGHSQRPLPHSLIKASWDPQYLRAARSTSVTVGRCRVGGGRRVYRWWCGYRSSSQEISANSSSYSDKCVYGPKGSCVVTSSSLLKC